MKKSLSLPALLIALAIGIGGALGLTLYLRANPEVLAGLKGNEAIQKGAQTVEQIAPVTPLNTPPQFTFSIKPEVIAEGRVRMAYRVDASAPITALRLHVAPIVKLNAVSIKEDIIEVPLYTMGRKSVNWDGHMDLTGSLLAGSPVTLRIEAIDKDKRSAMSDEFSVTLPERSFANPVAQSIYTLRKSLMEDPSRRLEVLRALAGVLQQREHFKEQNLILLTLRSAAVRIALDKTEEGLVSALTLLWHAALMFEENTVRVAVKF